MSTIERIEISHHRMALDPPFVASWDGRPRRHFDASVVRVYDDEGRVGIGSGDLMLGLAEHEDLFIGQDPRHLERHYEVLSHIQFHYGRCWPMDLALWDLTGKIAGEPVWRLLGGRSERVRAYASSGVLRDSGAMAETAERFAEAGFAAMKIRFHRGDWREDIAALEAVRKRVGQRLELMVDCNQGWRMPWDTEAPWTLKDAVTVARELERLDVYWMEEPLHRADREGLKRLRDRVDVRIAGGEMTRELYEFRDLIAEGCLDVLQPDCALVGGITGLRRIALMAREFGLTFTPHTWSNGFGVVANTHLTAGLGDAPFIEFPFDPPEWSLERRDYLLAAPFEQRDGWLVLDDTPGFGVALDEDRLAATRKD
ncbi:mandelate racemase/muconate lactonizing enzyme family protein [Pelagibius sp.]|uniref:mandelate racemase/muconate lactonizing enzyme family protein n=1 Tax=Pelagibius sp. TaxID=1931238 RepID=UPI00261C0776|nr:mandelate racemase/muconate lactonizing enzyme family protein [Pelagibius sp.]